MARRAKKSKPRKRCAKMVSPDTDALVKQYAEILRVSYKAERPPSDNETIRQALRHALGNHGVKPVR